MKISYSLNGNTLNLDVEKRRLQINMGSPSEPYLIPTLEIKNPREIFLRLKSTNGGNYVWMLEYKTDDECHHDHQCLQRLISDLDKYYNQTISE